MNFGRSVIIALCDLADRHGRKADLNWKLKISNTADNADITQSQARDTKHRRMQEVNSLCTDSGPPRAEYCIVGIPHNIWLHICILLKKFIIFHFHFTSGLGLTFHRLRRLLWECNFLKQRTT